MIYLNVRSMAAATVVHRDIHLKYTAPSFKTDTSTQCHFSRFSKAHTPITCFKYAQLITN